MRGDIEQRHLPAVMGDDFTRDVEPDAEAALALGVKKLDSALQSPLGEAAPGIGEGEVDLSRSDVRRERERAAGGHGLDGIEREIPEGLHKALPVSAHGHFGLEAELDLHIGMGGLGSEDLDCLEENLSEIQQRRARRCGPCDIEPLIHETLDHAGLTLDHLQRAACFGAEGGIVGELGVELDGGDGVLDLMSQTRGHAT